MITVHLTSMHVEAKKGGGRGQLSFGIHGVDLSKPPVIVCLFVVQPLVDLKWTQIIVHIKRIITKLSSAKKKA